MFKLSNEFIMHRSTPLTFKKGTEYFKEKRIKSIQFNQEKLSFEASVLGTRHYHVELLFNRNEELSNACCSCPEHQRSGHFCEHIISVLMMIREKDEQGFFDQLKFRHAAKQIFSFFQNRPNIIKTPVNLDITYEFVNQRISTSSTISSLSFRIGFNKLYVIKNVKAFLDSMEKSSEIQFGKSFSFDPSRHEFKNGDSLVIDFLRELYESEKLMNKMSYSSGKASLFKDKQVFLSSAATKRFFELMGNRPFKAQINDSFHENMVVRDEDFPVEFSLLRDGKNLMLEISFEGSLIPITDEGEYFYAGGSIYKTSKKQQENFKPFYLAMVYQKGNKIRFLEEDKEKFVSEILPFAEKVGSLKIDEQLHEQIEKSELATEIFLDKNGDIITADVRFKYGERIINPFAPIERSASKKDKILLRDMEKERIILDILGETEFKVKNNLIYLDEEDKIFDFVSNIIPKLQDLSSIFYSESFKNLTIRSNAAFSGGIRLNRETDMLEFSFSIEGIDHKELELLFQNLRERKKYFRLKDGSYLLLNSKQVEEFAGMAEHLNITAGDLEKGLIEIPKYRALYMDQQLKELGFYHLERSRAFKELVENILEPADIDFEVPRELQNILREYQKFGFKWLKTLSAYGLGGVLADDMGLGKTLQVIALVLSEKLEKGTQPSLIIAPTSLVYNWCAEVEKFAPGLKYIAVSGNKDERHKQMDEIDGSDLVITSYPLIRRDIDDYKDMKFRYCILDEAQHIKNPNSQNAKSVKEINANTHFALTGTPMENALVELWSIFDFVMPGYLFSHSRFVQKYENPIVKGEGKNQLEELGKLIKPFILRRIKSDVLQELPEKIEHKLIAELTGEQKKIYLAYLQRIRHEIENEINEKGFERSHIKILSGLTRLRQLCCHPGLFLEDFEGESGKMLLLQEIIEDCLESSHRILLFSQFTGMLHLISDWLRYRGIPYMYLDGSTPAEDRGELVKAFNRGQGKVFLISLKAGGTGLNLTGADTVIHYDPWWNPAVEEQATDRAYRIGQNKIVHVMKLITKGTIEEKIFELQEKKKRLIDAIIQPGETMLTKMTEAEIRALFE